MHHSDKEEFLVVEGGEGAKIGVNALLPSNIRKPSPECIKIELLFSGGGRLLAQEQGTI